MKIIICLDYSSFTEEVLQAVKNVIENFKEVDITIFHVIDQRLFYATTGFEIQMDEQVYKESKELNELCITYLGNSIKYIEEFGLPALKINDELMRNDYDLVIAGSHSHGLGERIVGSIAEHILRHSKKPVLIIP